MAIHRKISHLYGLNVYLTRGQSAFNDAVASAIAAALAWLISWILFEQPRPLFAAITAIICLAPGLPSHRKQSIDVVIGVLIGMLIGEIILAVPIDTMLYKVPIATFLSILIASCWSNAPVIPIQSAVSAVLVIAFGPETAGVSRLLDVVVGSCVGLLFSQVLLTPSLQKQLDKVANGLLIDLSRGLLILKEGLEKQDLAQTYKSVQLVSSAIIRIQDLEAAINNAKKDSTWSLRGRIESKAIHSRIARYDRRGIRLYASALLLAESTYDNLRKQQDGEMTQAIPKQIITGLHLLSEEFNYHVLLNTNNTPQHDSSIDALNLPANPETKDWSATLELIKKVNGVLKIFSGSDKK